MPNSPLQRSTGRSPGSEAQAGCRGPSAWARFKKKPNGERAASWRAGRKTETSSGRFAAPGTFWLLAFFVIPLAFLFFMSFGEKAVIDGQVSITEIDITGTLSNYLRAFDPLYPQDHLEVDLGQRPGDGALPCNRLSHRLRHLLRTAQVEAAAPAARHSALLDQPADPHLCADRGVSHGRAMSTACWDGSASAPSTCSTMISPSSSASSMSTCPSWCCRSMPPSSGSTSSFLEASLDLGASQFQTFLKVTVPLTMPGIISGIILVFIPCLGSFLTPDLLGGANAHDDRQCDRAAVQVRQ